MQQGITHRLSIGLTIPESSSRFHKADCGAVGRSHLPGGLPGAAHEYCARTCRYSTATPPPVSSCCAPHLPERPGGSASPARAESLENCLLLQARHALMHIPMFLSRCKCTGPLGSRVPRMPSSSGQMVARARNVTLKASVGDGVAARRCRGVLAGCLICTRDAPLISALLSPCRQHAVVVAKQVWVDVMAAASPFVPTPAPLLVPPLAHPAP